MPRNFLHRLWKNRAPSAVKNSRSALRAEMQRQLRLRPSHETLEDRRLLAVLTHPTAGLATLNVQNGDTYVDSGGVGGNYSNNETGVATLDSGVGIVELQFTTVETEIGVDRLDFHDGPTTADPFIIGLSGSFASFPVAGTGSQLTVEFLTDAANTDTGWEANIFVHPEDLVIPGTAGDDTIVIGLDGGGDLEVTVNGAPANIAPFGLSPYSTAFLQSITVDAGDGNDTIEIDYTNGPLNMPININGEGNDDEVVLGGTITDSVAHTFVSPSDGSVGIDFDGGGVDSTITYTGLEPIFDNLGAR